MAKSMAMPKIKSAKAPSLKISTASIKVPKSQGSKLITQALASFKKAGK